MNRLLHSERRQLMASGVYTDCPATECFVFLFFPLQCGFYFGLKGKGTGYLDLGFPNGEFSLVNPTWLAEQSK